MRTLVDRLVGKTIQEEDDRTKEDRTWHALSGMKAKFLRRMQGAGRDAEAEWKNAEPTYMQMLSEPEIQSQINPPFPGNERPEIQLGSEIYGIAERLVGSVPEEQQTLVHQIMQLAVQLVHMHSRRE